MRVRPSGVRPLKTLVLKGVCLLAMVGCEAEAPAVSKEARSELTETALLRAEKALENSGAAAEAPACRRRETRIYACDFGDRRVVVCAAENRLSYRFGDARRTDLEIDSRPGHVRAHVGGAVGGGGGSQTAIRFTNNGYHYIVHSMVAGQLMDEPGKQSSGVTVVRGEGIDAPVVRSLDCPQATEAQAFGAGVDLPEGTWAPEQDEAWSGWW